MLMFFGRRRYGNGPLQPVWNLFCVYGGIKSNLVIAGLLDFFQASFLLIFLSSSNIQDKNVHLCRVLPGN